MTQPPEQRLVVEAKIGVPGTVANNAVKAAAQAALSSDELPKQAAADAVQAEINGRELLESKGVAEDYSFAVVDEDNRRTWIEADLAGKPTARAATLMGDSVLPVIGPTIRDDAYAKVNTELVGPLSESVTEQVADAKAEVVQEVGIADILEADLIFSVVDEDGRRTWIEANTAGGPTDRALGLLVPGIAPAVGAAVGIQDQNEQVTDVLFGVVDEDGRRTELEVGLDGRLTKRVVDSIASRIVIPAPPVPVEPTKIVIPSALPMVVGQTYKLHYADFIDALDPSHTVVPHSSARGVDYGDRWVFTPAVAESFTLSLNVFDRTGFQVKQKSVAITVYAVPAGAGKRHLAIGDSITRAGNYSGIAAAAIPGMKTVGTRTYNDGALATEGRGGWALQGYFENIGHELWGDSPFLFPVGVAGNKFLGATEFWKRVVNTDPNGYDYQGFQKMARNWGASNAPFVFGPDGYPLAPAEGDVVVDATFEEADEFRQYTAGAWVQMPRPAIEFSFPKFMARYAAAFPDGGPTSISIMLQTNDFYNGVDATSFGVWKTRMDAVIASVRSWSSTVPFIILLAGAGGPPQNWAGQSNKSQFEFNRRMRDSADRILAAYDTTTARANKVYVTTFLGSISPANMSDHVHPAVTAGHAEMSPYLAGMLAKLITEGA
jgi:hypothetical protein